MLLSEQVRDFSLEQCLIDDATQYQRNSNAWGEIHNYGNFTLAIASIVVVKYEAAPGAYAGGAYANIRLKIGATYYVIGGQISSPPSTFTQKYALLYLAAGTYAVSAESIAYDAGGYYNAYIQNFSLGIVSLLDSASVTLESYTSRTQQVNARPSFYGTTARFVIGVTVFAQTPAAATNFENVGETLTNGVRIYVDGVQKNWSERNQDAASANCYGAAQAKLHISVPVDSSYTITLAKTNANTVLYWSIVSSTWLLGGSWNDAHSPITLTIPQGTTLYVVVEPLSAQLTKGVGYGKKHAVTGGGADYYSSTEGTGVLYSSYSFESQDPAKHGFVVYGCSGCISIIGADFR